MTALSIIGGITVTAIAVFAALVAIQIVGNLYGGIKGAYRMRAILGRNRRKKASHWQAVKLGLRAWAGVRSTYWVVGGLNVPLDGREKIERRRFP